MSHALRHLHLGRIAAAALLLAGFAGVAVAQPETREDRAMSATFHHCMDAAGGVDPDMRDCLSAEYLRWDAALNQTYRSLMARRSPAAQAALRREERAWLRSTRVRCEHAGDDNAGGTAQVLEIDDCYLTSRVARTLDLRARR